MIDELSTESLKAVTEEKETKGVESKGTLENNYQIAAANAINNMKQDLTTKEIEQKLRQEIEKNKEKRHFLHAQRAELEINDNLHFRGNCSTLKMETGKLFGITKIGARIMSNITVGGHEIMRNVREPSD